MNQKKKATGRKSWLKRLARWNTIKMRPAPLGSRRQEDAARHVRGRTWTKLSKLLHRDLSHWLTES